MQEVWTVETWCPAAKISKPHLYHLWKMGRGPRSAKAGRKRLIIESPLEFLARIAAEDEATRGAA